MDLGKILSAILGPSFQPRTDEFISPQIDIWYLRRRTKAKPAIGPLPFDLAEQQRPDPVFYKEIYKKVGAPWMWWERLAMSDEAIDDLFRHSQRALLLPKVEGQNAGFSELHFLSPTVTEVTYFGFAQEFVGKGLAKAFMEEVVRRAWRGQDNLDPSDSLVREIQLNTCSLDHPRARGFYASVGYEEYSHKNGPVHIPKHLLIPEMIAGRV